MEFSKSRVTVTEPCVVFPESFASVTDTCVIPPEYVLFPESSVTDLVPSVFVGPVSGSVVEVVGFSVMSDTLVLFVTDKGVWSPPSGKVVEM